MLPLEHADGICFSVYAQLQRSLKIEDRKGSSLYKYKSYVRANKFDDTMSVVIHPIAYFLQEPCNGASNISDDRNSKRLSRESHRSTQGHLYVRGWT